MADQFPAARRVFDQADEALGFSLSALCFEGPEDQLRLTENTQPAILTCSIATAAVLRERGVEVDYVAGHSLGEYSALVAAGALNFVDAVRLVRNRGRYMQEAVPAGVGAMAALVMLPPGKLESISTIRRWFRLKPLLLASSPGLFLLRESCPRLKRRSSVPQNFQVRLTAF